jgi:superfamily II DNA or RNA helicase
MARQFNDAGVMAACFTSDTDQCEREMLLREYRKPDSALRVLISVEALAKGFDVPDVSCVCDVRPLRKSLSTAIQMWGRGLRSSPNTGKTDCYLLDFSGNIIRFSDDFSDIFYNGLGELDCGEKLDKAIRRDDEEKPEGKACPQCGYKPCGKRCVSCGFEHQRRAEVQHEAGEMREVMIGKTKYADDKRHLWEQCVTYARGRSAPEKQRGRVSNIYKDITGEWPNGAWGFDSTPNVAITKPVLNKIRQKNMAFAAVHRKLAA